MNKMILIPAIFALLSCSSGNDNGNNFSANKAEFKLTQGEDVAAPEFKSGDYLLEFGRATVMEGSYSGLQLVFSLKENEEDMLYLKFELPAAKTMKVFLGSEGVVAEMPDVPFTVTEKDFQGLMNALYEKEQLTYILLERQHRYAPDASSVSSFAFNLFTLEVSLAEFGKEEFSMDCHFKGEADSAYKTATNAEYFIEGNFSIRDQEYRIAEVD